MNNVLSAIKETTVTMFTDWLKIYNSVDLGELEIMSTALSILGIIGWIIKKARK